MSCEDRHVLKFFLQKPTSESSFRTFLQLLTLLETVTTSFPKTYQFPQGQGVIAGRKPGGEKDISPED